MMVQVESRAASHETAPPLPGLVDVLPRFATAVAFA